MNKAVDKEKVAELGYQQRQAYMLLLRPVITSPLCLNCVLIRLFFILAHCGEMDRARAEIAFRELPKAESLQSESYLVF